MSLIRLLSLVEETLEMEVSLSVALALPSLSVYLSVGIPIYSLVCLFIDV